jgi:thioredoxin reductase (NADPH)
VISGKLDIVITRISGEYILATNGPGNFSGDMVLISGAGSMARGRVAEPGEFLEVTADALSSLIAKDAELSDIFMRAFIHRRLALIEGGLGNIVIMGSRHSANTLRLREFLTRNGQPVSKGTTSFAAQIGTTADARSRGRSCRACVVRPQA